MSKYQDKASIYGMEFVSGPLTISAGISIPNANSGVVTDAKKQIPIQLQTLLGHAGTTQNKGRGKKQNIPISIQYLGGILWIDLPSPCPRTPTGKALSDWCQPSIELSKRSPGDRKDITPCIAVSSMRESIHMDMAKNACVIWVGPPGS